MGIKNMDSYSNEEFIEFIRTWHSNLNYFDVIHLRTACMGAWNFLVGAKLTAEVKKDTAEKLNEMANLCDRQAKNPNGVKINLNTSAMAFRHIANLIYDPTPPLKVDKKGQVLMF